MQETRGLLESMEAGSIAISCKTAGGTEVWAVGEKTGVTLQLFVTKEELEQLVAVVSPGTKFEWKAGTQQQVEGQINDGDE